MKKKVKIIICSLVILLIALFVVLYSLFISDVYEADDVDNYLVSNESIKVIENDDGIYFDGFGEDKLLIFYPGANVDIKAYARLMYNLALKGIDTYILDVPNHFAFFGTDMASDVISKYNYDDYFVGGHSLGGVVATSYANKHVDKVNGIVLLASYPNEKVNDDLTLISIYGSNDGVLNKNKYNKAKINWSSNSYELVIDGGNHAGFGNYGKQKNDNDAIVTNEDEQDQTIEFIVDKLS